MEVNEGAGASAPALTVAEITDHLGWVERRLREMRAAGGWAESIAKYQACADELRELLEKSPSEGLTSGNDMCMVIYMETATATNTKTGESYEVRSLGLNMERNIERKFGVRFAGHTTDMDARTVTYAATNGASIIVSFG